MIGLGLACILAGCAAIANLQDPGPPEDATDAVRRGDAGGATGATGSDASRQDPPLTIVDAGNGDVYVPVSGDGGTVVPIAPTPACKNDGGKPNGDSCSEPSQCCTGACTENKVCNSSCVAIDSPCDPNKTGECCIRTYCSPVLRSIIPPETWCTKCLEKGAPAETAKNIFNQTVVLAYSCCSGVQKNGTCQ